MILADSNGFCHVQSYKCHVLPNVAHCYAKCKEKQNQCEYFLAFERANLTSTVMFSLKIYLKSTKTKIQHEKKQGKFAISYYLSSFHNRHYLPHGFSMNCIELMIKISSNEDESATTYVDNCQTVRCRSCHAFQCVTTIFNLRIVLVMGTKR